MLQLKPIVMLIFCPHVAYVEIQWLAWSTLFLNLNVIDEEVPIPDDDLTEVFHYWQL